MHERYPVLDWISEDAEGCSLVFPPQFSAKSLHCLGKDFLPQPRLSWAEREAVFVLKRESMEFFIEFGKVRWAAHIIFLVESASFSAFLGHVLFEDCPAFA